LGGSSMMVTCGLAMELWQPRLSMIRYTWCLVRARTAGTNTSSNQRLKIDASVQADFCEK